MKHRIVAGDRVGQGILVTLRSSSCFNDSLPDAVLILRDGERGWHTVEDQLVSSGIVGSILCEESCGKVVQPPFNVGQEDEALFIFVTGYLSQLLLQVVNVDPVFCILNLHLIQFGTGGGGVVCGVGRLIGINPELAAIGICKPN